MKTFTKICLSIALISIAIGMGLLFFTVVRRPPSSYVSANFSEDNVSDVIGLDIQMDYGEITITEGEKFSIEARKLHDKKDLSAYVSDGVWVIRQDSSESVDFFGFNVPISVGYEKYNTPEIKITVPRGFHSEFMKISLDAGVIKANNLSTDTGSFSVDAGSLEINGLVVEGKSNYKVSAGQIKLEKVDVRDITVECDVGYVYMDGIIAGENKIYCNVGSTKLELEDFKDNYSFDIESGLGSVIINEEHYHNKSIRNIDSKYKGSFLLNVDVGNITLDFKGY